VSRSSDSNVPPPPEPAGGHESIVPGLDPVPPGRPDPAPGADVTAAGDPGHRKGGRGRVLALAGGGPAIQPATGTCAAGIVCHSFDVSVADFPAHVLLACTCADTGGVWFGPSTIVNRGTIVTNSSGVASFTTYCTHPLDGTTVTIDVGGGGLSASGRYTT